jgi:hypothetical protein
MTSKAWRTLERVAAGAYAETPESRCGHCGELSVGATTSDDRKPKPGDISICASCAGVNRFDDALRLYAVSEADLAELPLDHAELEDGRALLRAAMLRHRHEPRVRPKADVMPPGYEKTVKQLFELIERWCGGRESLPDLQFFALGEMAVIAPLDADGQRMLARSPDAFELLAWLDRETGHEATVLQCHAVLEALGYLVGAEVLTLGRLRELGFASMPKPGQA